ncbi:c-type cytochrome domain-containing protein [Schlesneria paludicola]|uniref:c-type cytochrome domain-containing protein n=1 Tax=Schlesneria paludicola TaxID=360056 RepID=UPI00029AA1E2|nr:c-type cytochrome domain-containing protein [Schlesneria paludicola]
MRQHVFSACVVWLIVAGVWVSPASAATLTAPQRKELNEIGAEASKIASLVSKKKFDEASSAIEAAEARLSKFANNAGLKETDTALKPVRTKLDKVKKQLAKVLEKSEATFEKSVASIFAAKCVECHSEDRKGGFRLDTFEGLERGGASGQVIQPGESDSSLLMARLLTPNDEQRMPYGREPLSENEIRAIGNWISEGANFDGDKSASMATLVKSAANPKSKTAGKKAGITKEKGTETVHFMKDLMPELVDTCGRCHNDTAKRSGFSVMSFEKLMKGGDSGAVIVAGSLDDSRLWRLVNGDETPVMPAGNQTGITRKWHENLKTWIQEGATFDGPDPKKNFPSREEREAAALSQFTPAQWLEKRKKTSDEEWKKTFPNVEPNRLESSEFLLYGDVDAGRLQQVEKWATEQAVYLRQTFKIKDDPLWRGKLTIFVFKERFGYEEFNNSVHRREVPREVIGHSQVNATLEDAFVAVQDVGDSTSERMPGMHLNLIEQVTGAFLKRGGRLPDWLVQGAGLSFARAKLASNPYLAGLPRSAAKILQESNLTEPEAIFADGTFSPDEVSPVGFTLVEFLLKRGQLNTFTQLVQKIQSGTAPAEAMKFVYRTDLNTLALAYANSLPTAATKKGKK